MFIVYVVNKSMAKCLAWWSFGESHLEIFFTKVSFVFLRNRRRMSQLPISHRKLLHGGCAMASLGSVTLLRGNMKKIMWDIKEACCEQRAPGSPGNGCLWVCEDGSATGSSVSCRQPPARMLVWALHSFLLFNVSSKCSGKVTGGRRTAEIVHFRVFMPPVPRTRASVRACVPVCVCACARALHINTIHSSIGSNSWSFKVLCPVLIIPVLLKLWDSLNPGVQVAWAT